MGGSPLLLLSTTDRVSLTPEFKNTRIVKSNKEFDSANRWSLPPREETAS